MDPSKPIPLGFSEFPCYNDLWKFLRDFSQRKSYEFSDFREVWMERKLYLIFQAKPDSVGQSEYIDALFRVLSGTLLLHETTFFRLGAIYALWVVWDCQKAEPRARIRVTLDVWEELNRLQEELESCSAEDGLAVLNQLTEQKAFSFHVHVNYNYLIPALEGGCVISNEVVRLRLGSFNPDALLNLEDLARLSDMYEVGKEEARKVESGFQHDSGRPNMSEDIVHLFQGIQMRRERRLPTSRNPEMMTSPDEMPQHYLPPAGQFQSDFVDSIIASRGEETGGMEGMIGLSAERGREVPAEIDTDWGPYLPIYHQPGRRSPREHEKS